MVMGDLKAKVWQDNYMLNHVMMIHGVGALYNGERSVDFCSTNHLVIGGTRTVARESKIIDKSWNELKALAHNRMR